MAGNRHATRAARALAQLPDADPALGVLSLWCVHRDGTGPTRTEGETILYGPAFPLLPVQEQVGLLAHHVLHVALRHGAREAEMAERLGDRHDRGLYALATDAVVNETLRRAGHAVPRPAAFLTELLATIDVETPTPDAALAEWDADQLYLRLLSGDRGADGKAREYGRRKGLVPDFGSAPGRPSERDAPEWQGRMARALEAGRAAGTGIGALRVRIAAFGTSRTPWERHLRRLVTRAVSDGPRQSYRRPASRWIAMEAEARRNGRPQPVFQPGRARDARRARVAIGLDTSSSVDDLTLALFAAEAAGIARRTGAETLVLGFDETVHTEVAMGPGRWETAITGAEMRRDGGTDFRPLIARAAELAPSILVILSDLDGPTGPPPRVPVIWAVPGGHDVTPPFGRLVRLGA